MPSDQIDPMLFEKSYYLEPEKAGAKPYALLRQALLDADRMAVVTVALRQRTTIAVLRVQGRRDRAADDDVARRGPHPRLLGRDRRGQGRRGQDGAHAGRDPGRRLRRQRVRGRLRRRRRDAGEDQDRGRRDQAHPDLDQDLRRGRRPARRAAALGRRGQDRARRVGRPTRSDDADDEKPAKKTAAKKSAAKKAPAKKTAAKKPPAKKTAAKKTAAKKRPRRPAEPRRRPRAVRHPPFRRAEGGWGTAAAAT